MTSQIVSKKRVTFKLKANSAASVLLAADFTDWAANAIPLTRNAKGLWQKAISLPIGRHEYRFIVDGLWSDDPECTERVPNEFGTQNCVRVVE